MGMVKAEAVIAAAAPANALGAANFASGANSNQVGTPVVIYRVPVAAGVSADIDTLVVTHGIRIVDAWLVKTNGAGGGAGTIQIQTAAAVAVSSAMSINVADQIVVRPTTLDDATHEFAAGATVRIRRVRTASADETCVVYIMAVRT